SPALSARGPTTVAVPARGLAGKLTPPTVNALVTRLSVGAGYLVAPATARPTWVPSGSTAQPITVASLLICTSARKTPAGRGERAAENGKLYPPSAVTVPKTAPPEIMAVTAAPPGPDRTILLPVTEPRSVTAPLRLAFSRASALLPLTSIATVSSL